QCGICCQEIYMKITPRQLASKLFTKIAIAWIVWIFDFILIRIEYDNHYIVFTCQHRLANGQCGNYFWRANICRNFPLVDYFEKPKVLPWCGFTATERNVL
ncbi:MAG: hypothetical protein ABIH22_01350, partial [Candidatus Margulisiibacteriota bacterium]